MTEAETWESAAIFAESTAKTIRVLAQKFVRDGAIQEMAAIRAETLEGFAKSLRQVATKGFTASLIADATKAVETIDADELEAYAERVRKE